MPPHTDSSIKPRSFRKRFIRNFLGFGYSQVITLAAQFVTVPFFLWTWGSQRYAEWLVLAGLPSILSLLDFGVANASATKSIIHAAEKDIVGVRCTLQTAAIFSIAVAALILGLAAATSCFVDWQTLLKLQTLDNAQAAWVLLFLSAQLSINLLGNFVNAWYMAMDRASTGFFLMANRRLVDIFVTVAALAVGSSASNLALALFVSQAAMLACLLLHASQLSPWPVIGLKQASWTEFLAIAKPATAHAGITIGQVITLQGGIQFLNQIAPAPAVIMYSMGRTLMRLVIQIGIVVNHALRPEISRLLGSGEQIRAKKYARNISLATLALSLITYLILIMIGPQFMLWWSHNKVEAGHTTLALLGMHALLNVTWYVLAAYWMASNRHVGLGATYWIGAITGIVFLWSNVGTSAPIAIASVALAIPEALTLLILPLALPKERHR